MKQIPSSNVRFRKQGEVTTMMAIILIVAASAAVIVLTSIAEGLINNSKDTLQTTDTFVSFQALQHDDKDNNCAAEKNRTAHTVAAYLSSPGPHHIINGTVPPNISDNTLLDSLTSYHFALSNELDEVAFKADFNNDSRADSIISPGIFSRQYSFSSSNYELDGGIYILPFLNGASITRYQHPFISNDAIRISGSYTQDTRKIFGTANATFGNGRKLIEAAVGSEIVVFENKFWTICAKPNKTLV